MSSVTTASLDGPQTVHIVNPMASASGGSEHHALRLYHAIAARHEARLWATGDPDPAFAGEPIEVIDPRADRFPRRGVFVIVGCYFNLGAWYLRARPRRVVLIHNIWNLRRVVRMYAFLALAGMRRVELVHVSEWMRRGLGGIGVVSIPPVDPARFAPRPRVAREPARRFRVGRLSRDVALKHHAEDPALYRQLARLGCEVSIMGGTCLRDQLAGTPGIELLPACSMPAPEFLSGLDCFIYRTSDTWREPHGLVVLEAMACGIPVVCDARGGYAEQIEHGRDGFLFGSTAEALDRVLRLRSDPALRDAMGRAARDKVASLFSVERMQETADWYAGPRLRARSFHAAAQWR